jgi:orotate phosphoribosyltransferase
MTDYDKILADHAKDELREHGCLLEDGHVGLAGGNDATTYVDHRILLLDTNNHMHAVKYLGLLAQLCRRLKCEVVVGPERGGKVMAELLADILSGLTSRGTVRHQFISRDPETKMYFAAEGMMNSVNRRRVLFIDDVYTKGGTAREGIRLIKEAGGDVIAAAFSWNRGGGTAEALEVPQLISLIQEPIPDYAPGAATCPGCKAGKPYHPTLGHKRGPATP